jgi:serine/threonine protein kinase
MLIYGNQIHDIASGLQYLHSLNIVHGDIKGTNVLVKPNGRACLADFGLSTLLGDHILDWSSVGSETGCGGGTTRWKAPELVMQEAENLDSKPTCASDVYSLAGAAYEILTGQVPFWEIKGSEAVTLRLFRSREQPSRPAPEKSSKELTDEVWVLLECCWNHEPSERPSVEEILERLEGMMIPGQHWGGEQEEDGRDNVMASSAFRKSFKKGDYELSNEELAKVISMVCGFLFLVEL